MSKLKFVLYTADWCSSCKTLKTCLEHMRNDGQIDYLAVDIESVDGMDACDAYGIKNIPFTVVVDEDDNELGRFSGTRTVPELKEMCERYG